jgi:hypothetical protein
MVMILQFKDDMNDLNNFFRKLYSSPVLLWNLTAAIIFISLGVAILVVPSITGSDNRFRFGFGSILTIYGLFRFWTFYMGAKDKNDA